MESITAVDRNKPPPRKPAVAKPPTSVPARPHAASPSARSSRKPQPHAGERNKARPQSRFRRDMVLSAVLGGIVLGLVIAFVYGLYMPKAPWAFDSPEAQLPSLQSRHTLQ